MDGLIIKEKWLDLILSGQKTLEIRGSKTAKLEETIYLLESGTQKVRGTCQIQCCIPITTEEIWERLKPQHCVNISYQQLLEIYKHPYAWVLNDVKKIDTFGYYKHPKGAVIWVKNVKILT